MPYEEEFLFRTFDLNFQVPGEEPRAWQLTRPLPPMKGAYLKFLSRLIFTGVQQHRDLMDDYTYRIAIEVWESGFTDGSYAWRSQRFVSSFNDEENRKQFATEWLRQVDPKVTRQLVEKWWPLADSRADGSGFTSDGQPLPPETFGEKMWATVVEMFNERNPTRPPRAGAASS